MIKTIALSILGLVGVSTAAEAASPRPVQRFERRNVNQERRIQQGVAGGSLTKREAVRLEREQTHIRRMERRATADGVVTPFEKRRIQQAQNRASEHIFRAKHNNNARTK